MVLPKNLDKENILGPKDFKLSFMYLNMLLLISDISDIPFYRHSHSLSNMQKIYCILPEYGYMEDIMNIIKLWW